MIYLQIFFAFFIPGILGYGGGPASIPLIEHEVVDQYEWMTTSEFSEVLALGNALPGPIAPKMAGYIGYDIGGILRFFYCPICNNCSLFTFNDCSIKYHLPL